MAPRELRGVITASVTPMDAHFEIDVPRLAAHIGWLLASGCSFVSTFGTTGEGASLSTRQKVAALGAMKAAGLDMARQIPAIMTPTLDDAAAMLSAVAEAGCRGALVLPPFYYPTSEAGIVAFYDALVERAGNPAIDLLLYNIPHLSRTAYTPSLIRRLQERHGARIVGIKDSTGDLANGLMLVKTFPELAVFTGDDRVLAPLVAAGGAGMIGGMPNLCAKALVALYDDPTGPQAQAITDIQAKRIVAIDSNGALTALKMGLAHYRDDPALERALPPLMPLDAATKAAVLAVFQETGFAAADML